MNHDPIDMDFRAQLHGLGERLPPSISPAHVSPSDDLARGTRRRRRRRGAIALACVVVAASATGMALQVTGGHAAKDLAVTGDGTRDTGRPDARPSDGSKHYEQFQNVKDSTLAAWRPVITAEVDPQGKHVTVFDKFGVGGFEGPAKFDPSRLTEVSTQALWKVAGQPGVGVLRIGAERAPIRGCGADDEEIINCHRVKAPAGARKAWTWKSPGAVHVRVVRADGSAATVGAGDLHEDQPEFPTPAMGVTLEQMLSLANRPEIAVPAAKQ